MPNSQPFCLNCLAGIWWATVSQNAKGKHYQMSMQKYFPNASRTFILVVSSWWYPIPSVSMWASGLILLSHQCLSFHYTTHLSQKGLETLWAVGKIMLIQHSVVQWAERPIITWSAIPGFQEFTFAYFQLTIFWLASVASEDHTSYASSVNWPISGQLRNFAQINFYTPAGW